ncbi:phenylpyruvate tautomerase MIF-related protein [Acaryochloris sp. CCMEE 5410]|uniref:phenylpyruvate tautomerase MIF-related protein n=1 Tax=Acaryochloris sp. CCMEE 5410 TaxID=310037 RepID=UPI00030B1781|nr:phenylpyruvate tautomerase MIF-related protein [Acaryochloris sp. CCMEE 5410]
MPLIKVQSSISTPEQSVVEALLKQLSAQLAQHLGKPESYVMTAFEAETPMTFAGTTEPVCYVEIKSVGTMSTVGSPLLVERNKLSLMLYGMWQV